MSQQPRRTYLDHNATAPLRPVARAAMIEALDCIGNASSIHAEGRRAREIVEQARTHVARLLGAEPSEVVFTSGATEANAWVVGSGWDVIVASGLEHECVLAPARASKAAVIDPGAKSDGTVDVDGMAQALSNLPSVGATRRLVACQAANNETGVIQPVRDVAAVAKAHGAKLLVDAVQACGRVAVDVHTLGADFLAASSHKIGGPKGIGALVLRGGQPLPPLIFGGGQERRRRAGTENVPAIAGFGAAAAAVADHRAEMARVGALRDRLEADLSRITPAAVIVGAGSERLANTSCIAVPGEAAETLVIRLDLAGIAVSAGAACSSGKVAASSVLTAMGLEPTLARSAIRISLGWDSSERDLESFLTAWTSRATTRAEARHVA